QGLLRRVVVAQLELDVGDQTARRGIRGRRRSRGLERLREPVLGEQAATEADPGARVPAIHDLQRATGGVLGLDRVGDVARLALACQVGRGQLAELDEALGVLGYAALPECDGLRRELGIIWLALVGPRRRIGPG